MATAPPVEGHVRVRVDLADEDIAITLLIASCFVLALFPSLFLYFLHGLINAN